MPKPASATNRSPAHLIIAGCGPGELIAWALPLVEALKCSTEYRWEVDLLFWPRLFLSGSEATVVVQDRRFRSRVLPARALRLLAGFSLPPHWGDGVPRMILHMGGAALLSQQLARRLGCPVDAYLEMPVHRMPGFRRLYAADQRAMGLLSQSSGQNVDTVQVGNLIVDSMARMRHQRDSLRTNRSPANTPVIGLFPGSRPFQLYLSMGLLLPIVRQVLKKQPGCRFLVARAPFVTRDTLLRAIRRANRRRGPGVPALRLAGADEGCSLTDETGLQLPIVARETAFTQMDIMVSPPGTNSAEACVLGIPMLVVSPFDAKAPLLIGLPGMLERVPLLGYFLRQCLVHHLAGNMRYYAYPNIRAERAVVSELAGTLDAGRIAEAVAGLVADSGGRRRTMELLRGLLGPSGAAGRLVKELESNLD